MPINTKNEIKKVVNRSFLNKDLEAFRAELLQFSRTFFSDRIRDFSESSLGGMLLDFAAFVGDTMSFYLDHQFNELDSSTAIESNNIERHLRSAGVRIMGDSPSTVAVTFAIEVPSDPETFEPLESALPIIREGTILEADNGTLFELTEDLDFSSRFNNGKLKARKTIGTRNGLGQPTTLILTMGGPGNSPAAPDGLCVSGFRAEETFRISDSYVPFREITLGNENVTQILSIKDTDGNTYYEVDSLSQDTVFRGIPNINSDNELVAENLEIIPAPYRFTANTNIDTRLTTVRFGTGNAVTLNDDIIPDPSQLALPLYGRRTFSRFSLDPNSLLATQTLGVAPQNTDIIVTYRYGGGLSHNSVARSINTISTLLISFPGFPPAPTASAVRASLSVTNIEQARGGENALTIDELRALIPASRNLQSRIVTKPDLLARIYTLPSNFGRIFRAGIRSNPNNPLSAQLFVISRDAEGSLSLTPDTVKLNLRTYLNDFRLISDAIDILDSPVVNIGVEYRISTEPEANNNIVIQDINTRLKNYFRVENFQIDQPVKLDDIRNIIYNSPGVISIIDLKVKNINGSILDRVYSNVKLDISSSTRKGLIIGPPGSIFEMKFPDYDLVGSAV